MKTCPHCAEEVQDSAVKCKHCKSDIPASSEATKDDDKKPKPAAKNGNARVFLWGIYFLFSLSITASLPILGFPMLVFPIWLISTHGDREGGLARLRNAQKHKIRIALTVITILIAGLMRAGAAEEAERKALVAAAPQPAIEVLSATDEKQPYGVPYALQFQVRDADYVAVNGVQARPKAFQEGIYEVEVAGMSTGVTILAKNEFKETTKQLVIERELSPEEAAAIREWENSKAGQLCKKYPAWTKEECIHVADKKIWIGMTYDMLVEAFGKPDSANPSNYGSGTQWQWCWHRYYSGCFYDNDGDGKVDSYN